LPSLNKPFPDFTLPDFSEKKHHLVDFKGKPMALIFLERNDDSQEFLQHVKKLQEKQPQKTRLRLLIVYRDTPSFQGSLDEGAKIFTKKMQTPTSITCLYDANARILPEYQFIVPSVFLLDEKQHLRDVRFGYDLTNKEEVEAFFSNEKSQPK
jgi:peroxiredoxin